MILNLFLFLRRGVFYVRDHPQILFVLILLIVFPVLFLYTGQQFLDVGRANQETLQQQRIGLMHDVFASLVTATMFNPSAIQREFENLSALNPDIVDYKVLESTKDGIVPIVAKHEEDLGAPESNDDFYRSAAIRADESLIFETYKDGVRLWNAYRVVENSHGGMYFIFTQTSLDAVDALFKEREQQAYFSLIFVYCFIIALAFWHVRLTDYRYLYMHAKKANETKDLFTNMIAHELRAPLTAIRGYGSLLEERVHDQQQKEYASRVRESSERLITIVNDLLDVARIQSGKLTIAKENVDVASVADAVIAELRISAGEKHIALRTERIGARFIARADGKRLHQALTNLVSNAIKYTQEGSITLSLEEKQAYVELRVKDTGMGISAQDQKKLFAPFFRVANYSVDKITGTGLGMWITKELIELMGGTINVESIRGVGTHVVVTLDKDI